MRKLEVEAGRVEAGAGGHDQVGDLRRVGLDAGGVQALHREVEGVALVELHPRRGVGEGAALEEAAAVQHRRIGIGGEERIAVLDLAAVRHPAEQLPQPFVGQQLRGVLDELVMDVMRRDSRPDRIDVGRWHRGLRHPALRQCQ